MPPERRARSAAPALAVCLIACAAVLVPSAAHAYTVGDTLTVIWRPLPNLPAFARPGDVLPVWANAPSSVTGWNATLRFGTLEVPLATAGGGYVASRARWELGFTVPAGTPEEVYDLVLTSAATVPDTSRHCVKVLAAYRDEFYFAQITDTHLPMHAFSSDGGFNVNDTSGVADFDAVVDDLNLIHPEFVLHTGDLVNEGELEDYLGVYEMARSKALLARIDAPVFVVSGNHDLGGWQATPPADGTSRRAWWRQFGWPFLADPPAGDPRRTQDYTFDYGLLHVIGLESYINNGSYDHYRTDLYGAQSFTAGQLSWLAADLAALPQGHTSLLFYHYDFGGTLPSGLPGAAMSQVHPLPAGLDGAIWGHVHGVAEGNRAARPFDLGLRATVDGNRTFRIFRFASGDLSPGPMHHSGGTASRPLDSLSVAWNGPNDGTRAGLTAVVTNFYYERFESARLVFVMPDHDSVYAATGGIVRRQFVVNGSTRVEVDFVCEPYNVMTVAVRAVGRLGVPAHAGDEAFALAPPVPVPFVPSLGVLRVRFTLPAAGAARVRVLDVAGRSVATLHDATAPVGPHEAVWDGRGADGRRLGAGVYLVCLESAGAVRTRRVVVLP